MAQALTGMAGALVLDDRAAVAAHLLGAAATARADQPLSTADRSELDRVTSTVQLADPQFDHHFARGSELTPQEAVAYLGA
ncbi:hypothetical protein [Actinophytocola sp. NPDC049390]|uniref:hypothetical protein n=1 Tax=Actinophytocola sp. NPDC049390 TaxID=3363894 RepID=UPI00378E9034